MTTIAWDGMTLAADRCRVNGRGTRQQIRKLYELEEWVFGLCGDVSDFATVRHWLAGGAKWDERPELNEPQDPSTALVVRKLDGALFLLQGKRACLVELPLGPCAIGSGAPYALTAMRLGKGASEAVEIASQFDDGTGFGVDVWAARATLPASTATGDGIGSRALALVLKHEFNGGDVDGCAICPECSAPGHLAPRPEVDGRFGIHRPDCAWGAICAEARKIG